MEVTKFEDTVREALQDVMRHAVSGHSSTPEDAIGSVEWHKFCNDASHALHILAEAGIRPVNEVVATQLLDNR